MKKNSPILLGIMFILVVGAALVANDNQGGRALKGLFNQSNCSEFTTEIATIGSSIQPKMSEQEQKKVRLKLLKIREQIQGCDEQLADISFWMRELQEVRKD